MQIYQTSRFIRGLKNPCLFSDWKFDLFYTILKLVSQSEVLIPAS